jgi:hypothetical protein
MLGSTCLANASPQYPNELRSALELTYVPSCTLCHGSASTSSAGPVDTPFGKSMVARGLRGAVTSFDGGTESDAGTVEPSLRAALDAMRKDGVDSDGDGMEDLDELSWHGDPNHYDGLRPNAAPQVNYGCQLVPGSRSSLSVFAALAGLSVAFLGRRSRKV